jgi:uncharacterized protein
MYDAIYRQMKMTLGQLDHWLTLAVEYAKTKSFDPNIYLGFRLAPDQLPFVRQIHIACDAAKLSASRLTGKDAPVHADTEQTIDEIRARVASVIAYLEGFSAADFESASTRQITQPRWEGKVMSGQDYFLQHALPNFYFHVNHVYAILRHNGVPLGKKDYLGQINLVAPTA